MPRSHLERFFPNLEADQYRVTSPRSPKYNCVAWAAGRTNKWWEPPHPFLGPAPGTYWPPGIPAGTSLTGITRAFEQQGYEVCTSADLEPGFEKIAVYSDIHGNYTHAARQLANGKWTSKLGNLEDITHDNLQGLEGHHPAYGTATRYLKRRRR